MPFTTNPYATLAQVKSALDITSNQYDAWLTELLTDAQAEIDDEVGYSFQTDGTVASPSTRIYSGLDGPSLWIDDCISFSQVVQTTYNVILGTIASVTSQTTDITADVVLGPANISPGYLLRRLSGLVFNLGYNNYTVKGVWGQPAIPADITRATIRLTAHYFLQRKTNYADEMSQQGNIRLHYKKDIPADVMRIIKRHKRTMTLARPRT